MEFPFNETSLEFNSVPRNETYLNHKELFMANMLAVICVGTTGNLVNLMAVIYAAFRYGERFPWLRGPTSILILHLSLCDLLYCTTGLPFLLATLHGFFRQVLPPSPSPRGPSGLCTFTAAFRNLVAYADFLTMAAIALIRCIGIALPDVFQALLAILGMLSPYLVNLVGSLIIWMLAFAIISPAVFEVQVLGLSFKPYGWDKAKRLCQTVEVEDEVVKGGGVIYVYGVSIPFLVLITSYIALGVYVKSKSARESRTFSEPDDNQTIATKNQVTLLVLSLAYALFTMPLVPVHLGLIDPSYSLAIYSWYWWLYAINVIIYVIVSKDFREIYRIFFRDVLSGSVNSVRRLVQTCVDCPTPSEDGPKQLPQINRGFEAEDSMHCVQSTKL